MDLGHGISQLDICAERRATQHHVEAALVLWHFLCDVRPTRDVVFAGGPYITASLSSRKQLVHDDPNHPRLPG